MQFSHDLSFEQRLQRLDLEPVMKKFSEESGVQGADLERAEMLYRQYLTLRHRYADSRFSAPRLVDEVWHTHIMFTRKYFEDCNLLFGEYLHHDPEFSGNETSFQDITLPAYQKEFGINLLAYGVSDLALAAQSA